MHAELGSLCMQGRNQPKLVERRRPQIVDQAPDVGNGRTQLCPELEHRRLCCRGILTDHQRCFALAETLAHLDHLVLEGQAERVENETVVFRTS